MAAPAGRKLQVRYKDGEKTVVVPPGALVVTFKRADRKQQTADRSLLVLGAGVSLSAQDVDGPPTGRFGAGKS
jgi:hypothetical protein